MIHTLKLLIATTALFVLFFPNASLAENQERLVETILSGKSETKITIAELSNCSLTIETIYPISCLSPASHRISHSIFTINLNTVYLVTESNAEATSFVRLRPEEPSIMNFFKADPVEYQEISYYCEGGSTAGDSSYLPVLNIPGPLSGEEVKILNDYVMTKCK